MTESERTGSEMVTPAGIDLYVTEENRRPVLESYHRDINAVLNHAIAANNLGLGWSVQGYQCPTGDDDVTVREYRITVWRELMSQILPISPEPEEDE